MFFESFALSDKGLKREKNEDSYLINSKQKLFIVADGMGGHDKGEIASKIAVETINETISNHRLLNITNKKHFPTILNEAIENSHKKICTYSLKNNLKTKMGTTIAGIYKNKNINELCVFHMGDSRVYRIRNQQITLLTTDHTKYEEAKKANISKNELEKISKHYITKAIGNFNLSKIETNFHELKNDDIYIVCSDGVSNFIEEEYLLRIAIKKDLKDIPLEVKDVVYKNKARDNLTIIAIKYTH